jgi:hypothetical protein
MIGEGGGAGAGGGGGVGGGGGISALTFFGCLFFLGVQAHYWILNTLLLLLNLNVDVFPLFLKKENLKIII